MYSKVKKLLIFILIILFVIPNTTTLAQTNYKTDIKYNSETRQFIKLMDIFLKQLIDVHRSVIIIDKPGTYDYGNYKGTIIINAGNVTLRDTKLYGSLLITKAANNSDIILDNVQVKGKINNHGVNVNLQTIDRTPKIKKPKTDNNNDNNYETIVAEIKKNLSLEIEGAVGRKASPKLSLPISDDKGYQSSITWVSDNPDFIQVVGNEALIFRRGINGGNEHDDGGCDHEDGGCEHTVEYLPSLLTLSQITTMSCSDDESSPSECGGTGGDINLVCLTATIKKGSTVENKIFYVSIPWGWGRAITVSDTNPGSDHEHEHEVSEPVDKNYPDQQLFINQYPIHILPNELTQYGDTISNVECVEICSTTSSAITGSGIVAINIIDNSILKIEPLAEGKLCINADVRNSLGTIKVSFNLTILSPEPVDNLTAVNLANENLRLKLYSIGKDSKQINKLILPDTDCFGYGTSIVWESDKNEFINVDTEQGFGIINRRGSSKGGCDDHSTVEEIVTLLHSNNEEESCGGESNDDSHKDSGCSGDDSHEEGGCGDDGSHDESSQKGKGTNVVLKATLTKGEATITKNITVRIPWGWGRPISTNY